MSERGYRRFIPYGVAVLAVGIALSFTLILEALLTRTIDAFFFIAVIISTYFGGFRPGILAAVLSTLLINFVFIPPLYAFQMRDASDFLRLCIFLFMAGMIDRLNRNLRQSEQKVTRLNQHILEERITQQRSDRERVVSGIAQRVRQSLKLKDILTTTVEEVRQFLQTDRVIILRFTPDWKGKVVVESVGEGWMPIHANVIYDPCFAENYIEPFRQGLVTAKANIYTDISDQCHIDLLAGFQVRANLVVPILQDEHLWGLLIAHHCRAPRSWQPDEIDLLKQLATQLEIAIQQASLVEKLRTELQERQRTEEALRESEERWQLAITGANDGIWDHNLLTNETWVSPRGLEIVDYYYYEVDTLEKWFSYIHPDDVDRFQAIVQAHFNRQSDYINCEYRIRCKDGTYKWVLSRGQAVWNQENQPIRVVGSISDISDRKRTEAELQQAKQFLEVRVTERTSELQETERRWRSLLEQVQLIVVTLNRSGIVEYVNPFFLKLTGFHQDEVLGKHWFTHFLPAGVLPIQELSEREFRDYYENPILTKSGATRLISWNNALLRDGNGKMVGTISIGEDITKRQEVDRMKREFISIVSHELRTPLTAIRGSLGLLAAGVYNTKPEKATQMLRVASEQSDRLVRLVNDILDLQRLETGRMQLVMENCTVADLIQHAVEAVRLSAEGAGIQMQVETDAIALSASPDAIIQTLTNLISNAIKFSNPNSCIWIRTAQVMHDSEPYVLFQVQDQGRGIPSDKIETIFERFQQVDASDSRQKGGTGLGLAICKNLVQHHQGQIWVESQLGIGSTFSFRIPWREPLPED